MLKFKVIISFLFLLLALPLFSSSVSADLGSGKKVDSSNFFAAQLADYEIINKGHGFLCNFAGMSPAGQCIGLNNERGTVTAYLYDFVPGGGAMGSLASATVSLYNKPTSSTEYLANIGSELGLIDPSYAQSIPGSGDSIVRPVLTLWQIIRNFVYICYILVFLVAGFMIMFRKKISAQAVISIQSALPGLVVGLVLVTFSYLIASILVDFSFVGVQLVAQIFSQAGNNNLGTAEDINRFAANSNIFQLFMSSNLSFNNIGEVFSGIFNLGSAGEVNQGIFRIILGVITGLIAGSFIAPGVGSLTGAVIGGATGGATTLTPAVVVSLLLPLVLVIALFVQFFRLFFKLLKCYISLLIYTVIGPLLILLSSVPGQGGSVTNWWKTLLANALVFPAVFAAFLFAGLILGTQPNDWASTPPLFGNFSTELVRLLIAYGIILGTPAIPDMVKGAFGVKESDALGTAALAGFGTGYGAATLFGKKAAAPLGGQRSEYSKLQQKLRFMPNSTDDEQEARMEVAEQMNRLRAGGVGGNRWDRAAARMAHLFQRNPRP